MKSWTFAYDINSDHLICLRIFRHLFRQSYDVEELILHHPVSTKYD